MKEGDCLQSNYTSITKNLDYEEHHNYNLHILSLCRRERGREEGREREREGWRKQELRTRRNSLQ